MEVRLHADHHPRRRDGAPAVQLEHRGTHRDRPQPGQPQLLRHLHRGAAHPAPDHPGHGFAPDRRDDRVQHARRRQELRHLARHPHRQPSERDGQPGHLGRQQRRAGSDVLRFRRHLQPHRSSARLQRDLPAGHGPADRLHRHRGRRGPVDLRLSRDDVLRPGPALLVDGVRRRARPGSPQAHGGVQRTRLPHALLPVPAAELRAARRATRRSRSISSGRSSRNCSTAGRRSAARIRSSSSSSTARPNSGTRYRRRSWICSSSSTIHRPRTQGLWLPVSRWVRPTPTTCPSWDSSPPCSGSGFTSTTSTASPSLSASTRATARHRSRRISSSRPTVRRRSPGPSPST